VKQAHRQANEHRAPPHHEHALEAERILMVDLAATQAQAKGVAPSTNRKGGQIKTIAATPLNVLPPPSTDGVDGLYHQLVEIHAIAATQLVECARWRRTDPASSPVHARDSWQNPTAEPSAAKMAPPPPTDFSPQASLWQRG
jgi:hypothetical protein